MGEPPYLTPTLARFLGSRLDASRIGRVQMRFLSKKQLRDRIGLSPTQVARLEEDRRFPLRVPIGFRVFWVETEVDEWMQERADERNARPPKREDKSTE